MTAPQHAEAVLDAAILTELSVLSAKLVSGAPGLKSVLLAYKRKVERICGFINQDQHGNLLDYLIILLEGLDKLTVLDRKLSTQEHTVLQRLPGILSEYLEFPRNNIADEHMLNLLKDPQWVRPITEAEEIDLSSRESTQVTHDDSVELDDILNSISENTPPGLDIQNHDITTLDAYDNNQQQTGTDFTETTQDIDSSQQELIDLIRAELEEIIENISSLDHDICTDNQDVCINIFTNMVDQAENIGNALELIGLVGLSQSSRQIASNVTLILNSEEKFDENSINALKQWPDKLLAYLNNINDANSITDLLTLLSDRAWLMPLDPADYARLKELLENPVFAEEERQQRQIKATLNDVNLSLPEDVNQELLDGLLQDLPSQTEEFSTAIQNISEGGGLAYIDIAQRVAHTLKGAANVVGVDGIANLTHHLEDILQAQSKSNRLPDESLINTLVRASDCLESMAETLLGIDTEPEDAVNVLQDVLDLANKLDLKSMPPPERADEAHVSPEPACLKIIKPDDTETDNQLVQKNTSIDNVLRIPVALADEMLRLAGENIIYTSQIQEHINVIDRKQDTLDLHNQSLLQLSYDLEHLIDIQGFMPGTDITNPSEAFDPLEMDEYHEIHTISRRLIEIAADSVELSHELDKDVSGLKELVVNQNQLHKEGEELVLRTRMVPIKTIIPRLKRGVRQASRITGKQVELIVNDNNTFMDSEVLNSLIDPIMHILRNAIDHGIELEETRETKGKPGQGVNKLNFDRKGNQILIDIIDDGQGLDADEIHTRALELGLITAEDELSIENIKKLILEPGFTTRSKVTQVSGRGIGLDVVSVKIRELKGSIDINSEPEGGCRFSLRLPISSFSTHSLLVRVRQYIYAISSHGVEEILYPGIGEIRDVGDKTIFQLGQDAYSVVLIDTLLNLPPDRRKIERNVRPILLVKDESGSKTAILVQGVIDSRDVVVKSMGRYIPKLNGIIGATVLGDGSVSPVIDLPEMLHERNNLKACSDNTPHESTATQNRKLPYILVVDDSLSARRSLAQFVEDLGFIVRTARDGMEAVSIIETSKPDILLVDMEMPKMNGLELTSHIRATQEISNIPIIMITSRSSDKHRRTAIDKGVDHFMVKPFNEDELAQQINHLLET